MKLNYDELVAEFNESLHTKLRNFGLGPTFLEMWVPDEDHNRSLLGIFEAAEIGKITEPLSISCGPEIAKSLDLQWLTDQSKTLGSLKTESNPSGISLVFSLNADIENLANAAAQAAQTTTQVTSEKKTGQTQTRPMHVTQKRVALKLANSQDRFEMNQVYQDRVEAASRQLSYLGSLDSAPGLIYTVEEKGARLSANIDDNGVVKKACHQGGTGLESVLLDRLCHEMVGRSVQEVSEHCLIRLEDELRDHELPPPVQGIVTPENGDPAFKTPTKLARKLFRAYLEKSGQKPERNFWTDKVSKEWVNLSDNDKKQKIKLGIEACCRELGIIDLVFEVVDIQNFTRVILSAANGPNREKLGKEMIRLERGLKERVEGQLELLLEGLADRNKRVLRNPPPGQKRETDAEEQSRA